MATQIYINGFFIPESFVEVDPTTGARSIKADAIADLVTTASFGLFSNNEERKTAVKAVMGKAGFSSSNNARLFNVVNLLEYPYNSDALKQTFKDALEKKIQEAVADREQSAITQLGDAPATSDLSGLSGLPGTDPIGKLVGSYSRVKEKLLDAGVADPARATAQEVLLAAREANLVDLSAADQSAFVAAYGHDSVKSRPAQDRFALALAAAAGAEKLAAALNPPPAVVPAAQPTAPQAAAAPATGGAAAADDTATAMLDVMKKSQDKWAGDKDKAAHEARVGVLHNAYGEGNAGEYSKKTLAAARRDKEAVKAYQQLLLAAHGGAKKALETLRGDRRFKNLTEDKLNSALSDGAMGKVSKALARNAAEKGLFKPLQEKLARDRHYPEESIDNIPGKDTWAAAAAAPATPAAAKPATPAAPAAQPTPQAATALVEASLAGYATVEKMKERREAIKRRQEAERSYALGQEAGRGRENYRVVIPGISVADPAPPAAPQAAAAPAATTAAPPAPAAAAPAAAPVATSNPIPGMVVTPPAPLPQASGPVQQQAAPTPPPATTGRPAITVLNAPPALRIQTADPKNTDATKGVVWTGDSTLLAVTMKVNDKDIVYTGTPAKGDPVVRYEVDGKTAKFHAVRRSGDGKEVTDREPTRLDRAVELRSEGGRNIVRQPVTYDDTKSGGAKYGAANSGKPFTEAEQKVINALAKARTGAKEDPSYNAPQPAAAATGVQKQSMNSRTPSLTAAV